MRGKEMNTSKNNLLKDPEDRGEYARKENRTEER